MKKSLKILIAFIICMGVLIIFSKVYGASASINAGNRNLAVGESTTITVSVTNVEDWDLRISASGRLFVGIYAYK